MNTENNMAPRRKQTMTDRLRNFAVSLAKHAVLAITAFICAGIFMLLLADNVIMPVLIKTGTEIYAPNLIGKSMEDAQRIVSEQGFELMKVATEYNFEYPENTISFQYPEPNVKIKPGRRIQVRVSQGPRPVEMPNVVGKSRRDAELMIKPYGLTIDRFEWVHSNDYVRGIVARQDPAGNQKIPENTHITLYISDGLPELNMVMPRLIDLGLSSALDTLRFYKFNLQKVKTQLEKAPQLLPETVIDQHPDPGSPTYSETDIDLSISTQ